jgi:hypothetical protein
MTKLGVVRLSIFLVLLGGVAGCAWMNSPTPPSQPTPLGPPPIDPNAPNFTISFSRNDGQALEEFTVIQISPTTPANLVTALDDHTLSVLKPTDGQTIYFAINFGSDFDVVQMAAQKAGACPGPINLFLVTSFTENGGAGCGPNESPMPAITVLGQSTAITGQF